jgi:hypothetical protein
MQTMTLARTQPASDPRTRLIAALRRERQRRLAAIARYDRYIAEAAGHLALQVFWRNLRRQDADDAQRLKNWLVRESVNGSR